MATEADIERKCVKIAERRGCWLPKWTAPGHRGVTDRLLFRPGGRLDIVEFKAPNEKPRKLQEHVHRLLRDLGFEVHVVDSVEQFEELLDAD